MAKGTEIKATGDFKSAAKIADESGKPASDAEVKNVGSNWAKPPCSYVEGNGAKGDSGHK